MKTNRIIRTGVAMAAMMGLTMQPAMADTSAVGSANVKHVLLISIDGMHAVDFYNCTNGTRGDQWRRSVLPEHGGVGQDRN